MLPKAVTADATGAAGAFHTRQGKWWRTVFVHGLAAAVRRMILGVVIVEKFTEETAAAPPIIASRRR